MRKTILILAAHRRRRRTTIGAIAARASSASSMRAGSTYVYTFGRERPVGDPKAIAIRVASRSASS